MEETQLLKIFRETYNAYAFSLIAYACKFVESYVAEDLVQDVFLRVWRKRFDILWEEDMLPYLYKSVRYACLDHLRQKDLHSEQSKSVEVQLKMEELYFDLSHSYLTEQEEDRLRKIHAEIEKLPEKCREIFKLAYLEEKKTADIAASLNLSPRTVETQIYKALKFIRKAVLSVYLFF